MIILKSIANRFNLDLKVHEYKSFKHKIHRYNNYVIQQIHFYNYKLSIIHSEFSDDDISYCNPNLLHATVYYDKTIKPSEDLWYEKTWDFVVVFGNCKYGYEGIPSILITNVKQKSCRGSGSYDEYDCTFDSIQIVMLKAILDFVTESIYKIQSPILI